MRKSNIIVEGNSGACVESHGEGHCGWGADFCGFLKRFTFGMTTYSWQQY